MILYFVRQKLIRDTLLAVSYNFSLLFFPISLQGVAILIAFLVSAVFHEVLLGWFFIFVIRWLLSWLVYLIAVLYVHIEDQIFACLFVGYRGICFRKYQQGYEYNMMHMSIF